MLKLLGETLNPKIYYVSQVVLWNLQEPISFFLSTFGTWDLPSFPMQAMGFLLKVYCMIKKDLGCLR
jgi:hypothetical protein